MATLPGRNHDNKNGNSQKLRQKQSKTDPKYCSWQTKTQTRLLEAILLKPIKRNHKFTENKVEECNEIKAIEQVLPIGRGDEEDVMTDWSSGIQAELGKYKKMVRELEELEKN